MEIDYRHAILHKNTKDWKLYNLYVDGSVKKIFTGSWDKLKTMTGDEELKITNYNNKYGHSQKNTNKG